MPIADMWFMVIVHKWYGADQVVGRLEFDSYVRAKSFALNWSKQSTNNFSTIFIVDSHNSLFVRSYRNGFIAADGGFNQDALTMKEGCIDVSH